MSILLKTLYSHLILSEIFMKNPYCHSHIWSKKRQFSQHYPMLWVKIVIWMPFFFRFFTKKSLLSCPYLSKKRPFFKKHSVLIPIHYQKNVNSLKNTMLSCHFFYFSKNFEKNHHTSGILFLWLSSFVFSFDYPLNCR